MDKKWTPRTSIIAVTGIGLGTIYGYVKEMIIIIASQDGIVR